MEKSYSRSKRRRHVKTLAAAAVVTGAAALLGLTTEMLCLVLVSVLVGVVI